MIYKISITEPAEMNGRVFYGVTVRDNKEALLYTEYFYDEVHANQHVERLTRLIKSITE